MEICASVGHACCLTEKLICRDTYTTVVNFYTVSSTPSLDKMPEISPDGCVICQVLALEMVWTT
jgi:hypothetical protein